MSAPHNAYPMCQYHKAVSHVAQPMSVPHVVLSMSVPHIAQHPTLRNHMQAASTSVRFVPGLRAFVFDSAPYLYQDYVHSYLISHLVSRIVLFSQHPQLSP
eukprot:3941752-Rhodomonas_salina.2